MAPPCSCPVPSRSRWRAYIAQLDAARTCGWPITAEVGTGQIFWPAEDYHQDYLELNPTQPYISINDIPKVQGLQRLFPGHWRARPVLVRTAAGG